jgi:hypothetical protein
MGTKWQRFLDLVNTPRSRLPELIDTTEGHPGSGPSVEELLPSVESVWETIRFMLRQLRILDCETGTVKEKVDAMRGFRKIHLGNLEALTNPQWKQTLPHYISRDFSVVSKTAHKAAEVFLECCRMPKADRPHFALCRWCQEYFATSKDSKGFCSHTCEEKHAKARERGQRPSSLF